MVSWERWRFSWYRSGRIPAWRISKRCSIEGMADMEMPFLFPFEEQVNAFVFDLLEAEAVVKGKGGIEFLDVNGQRLARPARFVLQLTQEIRSDPNAPIVRQQRDVHEPDFAFS